MALDALFKPFEFQVAEAAQPGGDGPDDAVVLARRRGHRRRGRLLPPPRRGPESGLIVTEGTGVARPASLNDANVPRFPGEKELAAWKKVVDEVHAAGGLIAPRLWHVGSAKGARRCWARSTAPRACPAPAARSSPSR